MAAAVTDSLDTPKSITIQSNYDFYWLEIIVQHNFNKVLFSKFSKMKLLYLWIGFSRRWPCCQVCTWIINIRINAILSYIPDFYYLKIIFSVVSTKFFFKFFNFASKFSESSLQTTKIALEIQFNSNLIAKIKNLTWFQQSSFFSFLQKWFF